MERIGDLGRVGQHRVEHLAVRAGHVQRRPPDLGTPRRGRVLPANAPQEPRHGPPRHRAAARRHVHDRGRPLLGPPLAALDEQRLVQPERGHRADAVRVVDQPAAVGDDRVVDGVPVRTEIGRPPRRCGRGSRPGRSPTGRPGRSASTATPRSPGRSRSTRWSDTTARGSASGACATPASPAVRSRADRSTAPGRGP
jgi:hypothetical protein